MMTTAAPTTESATQPKGKFGRSGEVPLHDSTLDALRVYIAVSDESSLAGGLHPEARVERIRVKRLPLACL